MPVPTLVTDLSTTLASNSPAGSDNVFPSLDDYLRAMSGFIASIRDNSGNGWVSPYLPLAGGTVTGATTFSNTVTGTKFVPTGTSATGNGMYLPAANTLGFSTNGAEVARLSADGNLGLGVTPSAWINVGRAIEIGDKGTGIWGRPLISDYVTNAYYSSTGYKYAQPGPSGAGRYTVSENVHSWHVAPTGTAGAAISFTQAMTLDAGGNLGVGVTPSTKVHISDATSATVRISSVSGACNLDLTCNATQAEVGSPNGVPLLFKTSAVERARIDISGNLLVGTTTTITSDCKLQAKNSTTAQYVSYLWNATTTGDAQFVGFATEGTATSRGAIDYNRAGGLVRYNTTSDYRAKDIIGPVQDPGATIDALKVYEGIMKGATQSRPMLIAHEAQEHAPYAVSGVKDEVNEDGTPKFQQIDVSSLVPLLLAEIQSLRARVAALEA